MSDPLSTDTLKAARHALYDYRYETERYLGSWHPGEPKETDLCCEEHRLKFERNERINTNLADRLKQIVVGIDEITRVLIERGVEVS